MTDLQDAEAAQTTPALPNGAIVHPACGQHWTGLGRVHCAADGCHRTFSCDSAADRHRKGPFGAGRHCVDPSTVGLVAVEKAWGQMWQNPGPDPAVRTPEMWRATALEEPTL